mgnify:CR=1 FL=1
MINDNGHFVISLDLELHWGFFELKTVEQYQENLINTRKVIQRLLDLSNAYNVKLTFATVGFLFAKNKDELIAFSPKEKPNYTKKELNPYALFNEIGFNEDDDPYHFGHSIVKKIVEDKNHEVGTHTFSHYYCTETGQTKAQFEEDIKAALHIANNFDLDLESIVFPRNMFNPHYLDVCHKLGIKSYRGTENASIYKLENNPNSPNITKLVFRAFRMLDTYVNLTGKHTYNLKNINTKNHIINLPQSRFLRPYNNTLRPLEKLKIRRIIRAMRYAAKHNELFHLWWHPHNFGANVDENFKNLEAIFKEYKSLNEAYKFQSETMTSLTNKVISSL